MAKNYELLEHTADVGIKVKARDLSGLFRAAGVAMFDLMAEKLPAKGKEMHKMALSLKAADLDELFINWLNELLSVSSAEGLIFEELKIEDIEEKYINAVAIGSDMANYKVNREIKAATYHELKIGKDKAGWTAEVIFDV